MLDKKEKKVVIIGAGPAGLTAAYELCKARVKSVVLEKDKVVGGISRTVNYKGYHFDIGGHRFFTKVKAVDKMWHEVLSEEKFLRRNRISRIYYNKKFFHYPLRAANALFGLGLWNSALSLLSWAKAKMFPERPEETFEQWVSNRFGRRLYRIFFKTYTEKVWGIPCSSISAQWAAQRIKGLSLWTAISNALFGRFKRRGGAQIKTLIDEFEYPRYGPGMMWERFHSEVVRFGGRVDLGVGVNRLIHDGGRIAAVEIDRDGHIDRLPASAVLSTMPLRQLVHAMR